jgi:hypothetical protein
MRIKRFNENSIEYPVERVDEVLNEIEEFVSVLEEKYKCKMIQ